MRPLISGELPGPYDKAFISKEGETHWLSPFCIPDTALGSTDYKLDYHDDTVHHVSYVDTNQSSGIWKKGPDRYKAEATTF